MPTLIAMKATETMEAGVGAETEVAVDLATMEIVKATGLSVISGVHTGACLDMSGFPWERTLAVFSTIWSKFMLKSDIKALRPSHNEHNTVLAKKHDTSYPFLGMIGFPFASMSTIRSAATKPKVPVKKQAVPSAPSHRLRDDEFSPLGTLFCGSRE